MPLLGGALGVAQPWEGRRARAPRSALRCSARRVPGLGGRHAGSGAVRAGADQCRRRDAPMARAVIAPVWRHGAARRRCRHAGGARPWLGVLSDADAQQLACRMRRPNAQPRRAAVAASPALGNLLRCRVATGAGLPASPTLLDQLQAALGSRKRRGARTRRTASLGPTPRGAWHAVPPPARLPAATLAAPPASTRATAPRVLCGLARCWACWPPTRSTPSRQARLRHLVARRAAPNQSSGVTCLASRTTPNSRCGGRSPPREGLDETDFLPPPSFQAPRRRGSTLARLAEMEVSLAHRLQGRRAGPVSQPFDSARLAGLVPKAASAGRHPTGLYACCSTARPAVRRLSAGPKVKTPRRPSHARRRRAARAGRGCPASRLPGARRAGSPHSS